MVGMLTLALYNSYDRRRLHDAHLRAVARAAPIAYAHDFHLALVGFPVKGQPIDVAEGISGRTTVGEGGAYLLELARADRFHLLDFPKGGFPPQFGRAVATTRKPEVNKAITPLEIARRALAGESFLFLVGLGRHGLPKEIFKMTHHHLDVTGRGVSLETCTAIGAIPVRITTFMEALKWTRTGKKT